jgi:hypothetical protein
MVFLLSIAICVLALLMLRHTRARACRDYIEQRQPSAGIVVSLGTRTFPHACQPLR